MKQGRQKLILGVLVAVWVLVALWVWSTYQARPSTVAIAAPQQSELAFFLQEAGPVDLHLEWFERQTPVGPPRRDLFSTAPIATATAAGGAAPAPVQTDPGAGETVPEQSPIGAELRYLGYVETGDGTLALLREGAEMYFARQGSHVGPGYLVAIVDESFVEIEFKGTRRRLPVSRGGGGTNGKRP